MTFYKLKHWGDAIKKVIKKVNTVSLQSDLLRSFEYLEKKKRFNQLSSSLVQTHKMLSQSKIGLVALYVTTADEQMWNNHFVWKPFSRIRKVF